MDPMVIVSPHLDDAVLSAGRVMSGRENVVVVTVFTGLPDKASRRVTSFDRSSGFRSAREAVQARGDEDARALAILGATPVHLGYLDGQYGDNGVSVDDLATVLRGVVAVAHGATVVAGPVGIEHPDHRLVADAFLAAVAGLDVEAWLYEELPNRVMWPEQVPGRLACAQAAGFRPELSPTLGGGDEQLREAALGCYESQLWALHPHAIRVPERWWRLWPTG